MSVQLSVAAAATTISIEHTVLSSVNHSPEARITKGFAAGKIAGANSGAIPVFLPRHGVPRPIPFQT
jgi:hypothetical protein